MATGGGAPTSLPATQLKDAREARASWGSTALTVSAEALRRRRVLIARAPSIPAYLSRRFARQPPGRGLKGCGGSRWCVVDLRRFHDAVGVLAGSAGRWVGRRL